MTHPDIMSLEYRAMLRAAAEFDVAMRAAGWMRGKVSIRGPQGQRFPPDTPDEVIAAAFQSPALGLKDTHGAIS